MTFKNILDDTRKSNCDALFQKAQQASCIAKLATGRSRRCAYRRKNSILAGMIMRGEVQVVSDRDFYPGLLKIIRPFHSALHSHEIWLGYR